MGSEQQQYTSWLNEQLSPWTSPLGDGASITAIATTAYHAACVGNSGLLSYGRSLRPAAVAHVQEWLHHYAYNEESGMPILEDFGDGLRYAQAIEQLYPLAYGCFANWEEWADITHEYGRCNSRITDDSDTGSSSEESDSDTDISTSDGETVRRTEPLLRSLDTHFRNVRRAFPARVRGRGFAPTDSAQHPHRPLPTERVDTAQPQLSVDTAITTLRGLSLTRVLLPGGRVN